MVFAWSFKEGWHINYFSQIFPHANSRLAPSFLLLRFHTPKREYKESLKRKKRRTKVNLLLLASYPSPLIQHERVRTRLFYILFIFLLEEGDSIQARKQDLQYASTPVISVLRSATSSCGYLQRPGACAALTKTRGICQIRYESKNE